MIDKFKDDNWTILINENATLEYALDVLVNLIDYNHILGDLKSVVSCQSAENAINRIESSYCVNNFDKVEMEIFAYLIAILGIFLLAVGLNKVILIINRDASKSLRGQKKYQKQDLDEDEENAEDDDESSRKKISPKTPSCF